MVARVIKNAVVAFILTTLGTPAALLADQEALGFTTAGTNYYQGASYSLGWRFTLNKDISVTGVGFYDDNKDGLSQSHDVGIYDVQTCTLRASGTVQPSDPLTGFFRYHSITPVTLTGGQAYYVAAVTGSEHYTYSVATLNTDTAITFWGYAIYGNTQATSSLQCPNGIAGQQGLHSEFGPSFLISDATSGGSSSKQPAISLFCNRTGVNLETADCSVTVGDKAAPPRTTPTGSVTFSATDGIFPSSGSCNLAQTPYSPGVASCSGQFTLPLNFPIGIAFPIDATYNGDSHFDPVSTSHSLIQTGCVGDATNPCSGAVALTFADLPQILKNAIATIFECGQNTLSAHAVAYGILGGIGQCIGSIAGDLRLNEFFAGLDLTQIEAVSAALSSRDANSDPFLKAVKALGDTRNETVLQQVLNDKDKIAQMLQKILDEQAKGKSGIITNLSRAVTKVSAAKKRSLVFQIGTTEFAVKNNSRKTIKVKLTKPASKFAKALKRAGRGDINVNFTIKGKRARGPKHAFKTTQVINVGLS